MANKTVTAAQAPSMNPLSDKQLEFVLNSTATVNLAHGSVRCGKTVGTLYRFMQAAYLCPDSQIWMIGHTSSTIFDNAIRLIIEPPAPGLPDPLAIFRPFCTWSKGDRELRFNDKVISTVGVNNSGALGVIQGKTFSLCYCDEMTLYPDTILDMINTRLSLPHSMLIGTMNPMAPSHKVKKWIDAGLEGDKRYYSLHFTLDDNPYVSEIYKEGIRKSLSGVFYKRNYLGLWCLAEGAIFDFFDKSIHVVSRPPRAANYWIVGIDYGTSNAFAAVLIGVNLGIEAQMDAVMWVEDEYYWDSKKTQLQKLNHEYADELKIWLGPYGVKNIYMDPSAEAFRLELQRRGMHVTPANNEVSDGIQIMTSIMKKGDLCVHARCKNLIREIEGYVWDENKVEKGDDAPLKRDDHAVDALRYAVATHKINRFDLDEYNQRRNMSMQQQWWERGGPHR
jgi:PBSX family phage terminase large subunit